MEAHFYTSIEAPIIIGGIPNEETMEVDYAIEIPGILSFLAFNDFSAEVKGLEEFPREHWPPILVVHFAFQVMVGIGSLLALCSPLGFIAIDACWYYSKGFCFYL